MPIHLGQILESVAKEKGFSNKKLGKLLNKHEKTVADIFKREFVTFDYMVLFSQILNTDFLKYYYQDEPFKSFREEEETKAKAEMQRMTETIKHLNEKLGLAMDLIEEKNAAIGNLKKRVADLEIHTQQNVSLSVLNEEEVKYNAEKKANAKPGGNK